MTIIESAGFCYWSNSRLQTAQAQSTQENLHNKEAGLLSAEWRWLRKLISSLIVFVMSFGENF